MSTLDRRQSAGLLNVLNACTFSVTILDLIQVLIRLPEFLEDPTRIEKKKLQKHAREQKNDWVKFKNLSMTINKNYLPPTTPDLPVSGGSAVAFCNLTSQIQLLSTQGGRSGL